MTNFQFKNTQIKIPFFCIIPWKSGSNYWFAWMGLNLYEYHSFRQIPDFYYLTINYDLQPHNLGNSKRTQSRGHTSTRILPVGRSWILRPRTTMAGNFKFCPKNHNALKVWFKYRKHASINRSWLHTTLEYQLCLTPNTPLVQLWCARSKLNMDEICSLNFYLSYLYAPQNLFFEIPLYAKKVIFVTEFVTLCSSM